MTFKISANLFRVSQNKNWALNLSNHNYFKLKSLIILKYYLLGYIASRNIFLLSLKIFYSSTYKINIFLYYYKFKNKNFYLDKILKLKIEKELKKHFPDLNFILYIKNIINFLPLSIKKDNSTIKEIVGRQRNLGYYKNLLYIINISTYKPNAFLLSHYIVNILCGLKKQWPFLYLTFNYLEEFCTLRDYIDGIKIAIAGRISGRKRKKTTIKTFGNVPTYTLCKNIKYSLCTGYNIYGAFSIKIWITSNL